MDAILLGYTIKEERKYDGKTLILRHDRLQGTYIQRPYGERTARDLSMICERSEMPKKVNETDS